MSYFFSTKRRLLLLSALLGVSFFVGGDFLFAQASPFRCFPQAGSESGSFRGDLTIPEGAVNTDSLSQNKDFFIKCENTTDPSKVGTAKAAAKVIEKLTAKVDLTVDVVPTGNDDQPDFITAPYGTTHILRWKSQNVSSCFGTGFSTGGALNNTDKGVPVGPLVNERNPYSIKCTAAANAATLLAPFDDVGVFTVLPSVSCAPDPVTKTTYFTNESITWK
ncbi:MAG: hypothetical protein HYS57_02945, partial [Parcubacteria group bacterium]|nr:hypothetical protein [Parcubacteria group bacterium]